ncbi:sigma-54-dependent transcriptional regulator [Aminiphilus circumscriptus]|jgi:DNA-binding NtrC family response regulator|uniref:sigma-54-dependent transcriptional regulator n=1 Tax=Aminiphilus circumscriptus TaxID=290732 RepID=UPI0004785D9C|nr:sigma-54 dependent transcriptional regulator [Aminiphilus circumscriptus]
MEVWIVDDEKNLNRGLAVALEKEGYEVASAYSLADLERLLQERSPDVVLLDVRLPDGDGIGALPSILRTKNDAKVVVMTAYGDSPTIVRAIQEGAYDFLDKPFPLEAVTNLVARAAESILLKRRISRLQRDKTVPLVGDCPALETLRDTVERIAEHRDVNVLLSGESGTGKEVLARLIAHVSDDSGDFIALNCAAIPESLLEVELFGSRRGAYTGASQDRIGLIESADGGTLFLDEIADLPQALQGKLLRFLDDRTVRPLGATRERKVSLRVICATAADLRERVEKGTFRQDLYYRIATIPLSLPPLRERGRDVLLLAETFLAEFNRKRGGTLRGLTPDVQEVFLRYSWPGNVRELRNLLERICILKNPAETDIRLCDLPAEMVEALSREPYGAEETGSLQDRLVAGERTILKNVLAEHEGNRTKAAASLGISRYALLRKLQKHHLV